MATNVAVSPGPSHLQNGSASTSNITGLSVSSQSIDTTYNAMNSATATTIVVLMGHSAQLQNINDSRNTIEGIQAIMTITPSQTICLMNNVATAQHVNKSRQYIDALKICCFIYSVARNTRV